MPAYAKGAIIMRCRPLSSAVVGSPANITKMYCHHCFRPAVSNVICEPGCKLRRCNACRQVAYCSVECQRLDWTAAHRNECRYLIKAQRNPQFIRDGKFNLHPEDRSAARLLLRLARREPIAERFFKLDSHWSEYTQSERSAFKPRIDAVRAYLVGHKYTEALSDLELGHILSRDQYHSLCGIGRTHSKLCCIEIAELTHSCAGNASVVLREDACVYLIANRTIESNSDVRVSLVSDLVPGAPRRDILRQGFFIDCNCVTCERERSGDSARDDLLRSIRCSKAFDESFAACNAPIPMTADGATAIECCANGHEQTYTAAQLERYYSAVSDYDSLTESLAINIRCDVDDDLTNDFPLLERFWHPINWHACELTLLMQESAASCLYDRGTPNIFAWACSMYASIYDGSAKGLVTNFERHFEVDSHRLFDSLLFGLCHAGWGAAGGGSMPTKRGTLRAVMQVLAELVPLAELYYGVQSRVAVAMRRASAMPPDVFYRAAVQYHTDQVNWKLDTVCLVEHG